MFWVAYSSHALTVTGNMCTLFHNLLVLWNSLVLIEVWFEEISEDRDDLNRNIY